MENPFEKIVSLSERSHAFLDDTAQHYKTLNRSYSETGRCTYQPAHKNTKGCAIGRWLDRDNPIIANQWMAEVSEPRIQQNLPEWMAEMGIVFLARVQMFHDEDSNWDVLGLTEKGLEQYNLIKRNIARD
jgi:hypothetical protein